MADGLRVLGLMCPHMGGPKLEKEDVMVEHAIYHVCQLEVLLFRPPLDLLGHCLHLPWVPLDDALLFPGYKLPQRPNRER